MSDRIFHQINSLSSYCYSQKYCCRKEAWAMQKLSIKKKKEREKESIKNE
jgi:hypothetical protein